MERSVRVRELSVSSEKALGEGLWRLRVIDLSVSGEEALGAGLWRCR
jgi:hypothetical protein